jgi:hypothetical protein
MWARPARLSAGAVGTGQRFSATGIAGPKNGTPPPRVPLAEIDLDTMEFWEWDDDLRDGAFATLRRESPISFFEVPEYAGFPSRAGH